VAEVPEGGAELQRVARRAPGRGLAVGDQAGEGLVPLLGVQGRAELDDAVDLAWSGVSLGVRDARGDDDRLARSGHEFRTVKGEVGLAGQDGEALLLAGWTCSVITPPGILRQVNRTSCPSLSSARAV
jgi:hypothetical protein